MGLIKAATGAIGGTLKDQWKEALRCDDMGNDILMKKVTTPTGVISNKSTIIVGPGQCAIIYDNGKVIGLKNNKKKYRDTSFFILILCYHAQDSIKYLCFFSIVGIFVA